MALKVLIVDDDPDMAELTCEVLESHGMDAKSAPSVPDALSHVADHAVDVVVTDVVFGAGATGLDLCRELATTHPAIRVVVLSGDETARDAAMRLGAKAFFLKPTLLTALVDAIAACSAAEPAQN